MSDWDKPDNMTNTIGYLTLYNRKYDGELSDYINFFDWDKMPAEISRLQNYFETMLNRCGHNEEVLIDYDLVGINSNSFKNEKNRHHLFLEWDRKFYEPDMHVLEAMDGMIIETAGGFHVIKEADLDIGSLVHQMKRWNCCRGFTNYAQKKLHACLRVCPKGNNKLKIIKNKEGFLYSVYRDLVEGLENSWVS